MNDRMENYVWTSVSVEKELQMESGRVARVFRDILEKLHFSEEEKAWYKTDTSRMSEKPAGDSVKRGYYIFGSCNAPQDIEQIFCLFEKRTKSGKENDKITEHMINTLKYSLYNLLPYHRNKSDMREASLRKYKEEFYQLHNLLMQLRSLNIIDAALNQQEELYEQYADLLNRRQLKELEQVAKMIQKCCEYSVANEKPVNIVQWMEDRRRRRAYAVVIDSRVEAYFAERFRDFYFEKQIWVKQERSKGRTWKALYREMYKAVAEWHHRWMQIMTISKELRELEREELVKLNIYDLFEGAVNGVQDEAFISKDTKDYNTKKSISKELCQDWCGELVHEILSHELRQNYIDDYNYMLIRAFLELNDLHDKIAKEQQMYCSGIEQEEEEQKIMPNPVSGNWLGTYYEALFRQYK